MCRFVPPRDMHGRGDLCAELRDRAFSEFTLNARALDYVMGPLIAALGMMHVVAAIARRHFVPRTALILSLSVMATMTLRHPFLTADPWHIANGSTPGLVLLVALMAGGRRLYARTGERRLLPVGGAIAALLPVLWLGNGAATTINARRARIAAGDERPSFGPQYRYDDLPRAGDVMIGNEHLGPVRFVRAHSKPNDPVFCATWSLGGGTEAFLSERRNPTAFDKQDEIVSDRRRRRLLAELEKDPPLLIVGQIFDFLGPDARSFIDQHWHKVYSGAAEVRMRNQD
jgi:hypothetical protein